MKRTLTLALTFVMGATFATQAFAQDAFPDTPENHWAYEALATMRRHGLLVGYPDGLFRGGRPASRYEMAVALHALYQHLRGLADGFDARLKALEGGGQGVTPAEMQQIRDMIAALKRDHDMMKAWGDDIANLKKMAATFERELASMGVDVEALKKGINDLAARVDALEKRKPAVDIHGNVDMLMMGGYSDDGHYGISPDGRPLGVSHGTGDPSDMMHDLNFFHEGQLVLTGTNDTGPKWKAVLSIGNILTGYYIDGLPSSGMGSQSHTSTGLAFWDGNDEVVYFQEFNAWWDFTLGGQKGSVKMGRVGKKLNSYTLRRPDVTPYWSNEYWDNGEYMFDGMDFNMMLGGASLTFFGGRSNYRLGTNGEHIQNITAGSAVHPFYPGEEERPRGTWYGAIEADRIFGASLGVKLGGNGKLNLNWVKLDQDYISGIAGPGIGLAAVDNATIFGGDVSFGIGDWMLNAGYSQSNVNLGESSVVDRDNGAWWASFGTKRDNWGFTAGYRHIDPLFAAPGDWGRLGIWWNPSDIEGFFVKGHFGLNSRLMLHGAAEFYQGSDTSIGGFTGLLSDDEIRSFKLDLVYNMNDYVSFWLGAEMVDWDLASRPAPPGTGGGGGGFAGGETEERWYNIGMRYRMTDKASFTIRWQISDYDSKGTLGMEPFGFSSDTRAKGGVITSTLGIKF